MRTRNDWRYFEGILSAKFVLDLPSYTEIARWGVFVCLFLRRSHKLVRSGGSCRTECIEMNGITDVKYSDECLETV